MSESRNATRVGAAMIAGGMVVIGLIDNFVRVIAEDVGLWQFHLMRSLMALPLLGLAAAVGLVGVRPLRPSRVAARAGVQAASMLLYFGALPFMPIAQVGAGLFTAPLFVLLFSAVLFGHRIGPRRLLAVGIGFTGVLVVLRPGPDIGAATLVPVAAGALYGLSNLITREWCAREPVGALLAAFFLALGLAGAAGCAYIALGPVPEALRVAAPFLARDWAAVSGPALFWIVVQAVGSLAAVGLVTRGYQSAETSYLTVFEYSFLITASFWAWVIWGDALDAAGFVGIALIIASGAIIAWGPAVPAGGARRPAE